MKGRKALVLLSLTSFCAFFAKSEAERSARQRFPLVRLDEQTDAEGSDAAGIARARQQDAKDFNGPHEEDQVDIIREGGRFSTGPFGGRERTYLWVCAGLGRVFPPKRSAAAECLR